MPTEVITDATALAALETDWLDLAHRTPGATPFQTPMWLLPWWRAFGSNDLAVIAARNGSRLEALAPLYIIRSGGSDTDSDESLGVFLGTGISDHLDVLGDAALVIDEMAQLHCQLWDLQQLPASSSMLSAPLPDGFSADSVEDQEPCPILSIDGAGDDLQNLVSTHFRKKIRYYRRALERIGEVRIESPTPETLDGLLTALFDLHAARWQRRGLPGLLADDASQQFHRDVARRMLTAGKLRLYATRCNDRIVAVFYGYAFQGTVYFYLSGYDPDLEKLSIGTILAAHAIEEAARDGP